MGLLEEAARAHILDSRKRFERTTGFREPVAFFESSSCGASPRVATGGSVRCDASHGGCNGGCNGGSSTGQAAQTRRTSPRHANPFAAISPRGSPPRAHPTGGLTGKGVAPVASPWPCYPPLEYANLWNAQQHSRQGDSVAGVSETRQLRF